MNYYTELQALSMMTVFQTIATQNIVSDKPLSLQATSNINVAFKDDLVLSSATRSLTVQYDDLNSTVHMKPSTRNMVINNLQITNLDRRLLFKITKPYTTTYAPSSIITSNPSYIGSNIVYVGVDGLYTESVITDINTSNTTSNDSNVESNCLYWRPNTVFQDNVKIHKHLYVASNIYGRTVNVFQQQRMFINSNIEKIGYGFTVSPITQQLELIKFTEFKDKTKTMNKILALGGARAKPTTSSTSYFAFDETQGIYTNTNIDATDSNIPVFITSNANYYNNTTLYGDIIPTSNQTLSASSVYTQALSLSASNTWSMVNNNLVITNANANANASITSFLSIDGSNNVSIGPQQSTLSDGVYIGPSRFYVNTTGTDLGSNDTYLASGAFFRQFDQFTFIHGNTITVQGGGSTLTRLIMTTASNVDSCHVYVQRRDTKAPIPLRLQAGTYSNTALLGIGMSNPTAQLDLSTDAARKLTTTTWSTGSDARVKQNIKLADLATCYSNIRNLQLKRFKWQYSNATDQHVLGWIAQDVEQVFPNSVTKVQDYGIADFRVLNSDQIMKTMVGALQHLIHRIEYISSAA